MSKANSKFTPGDVWQRQVPYAVPPWTRMQVCMIYNIPKVLRPLYVIDHLIPLELNGTNSIYNLWPMPIWDIRHKREWEAFLRGRVRAKLITLQDAQNTIREQFTA